MGKQLVSSAEARPCANQHRSPCPDCPWARRALPGWLGGGSVEGWLKRAHREERVDYHTLQGPQCAGMAIYRANVCKKPRYPEILVLGANREKVFATPAEFRAHHEEVAKLCQTVEDDE